jgi:hypothetical protein
VTEIHTDATETTRSLKNDKRVCGAKETVIHVLSDFPNQQQPCQEMRRRIGATINDIPLTWEEDNKIRKV